MLSFLKFKWLRYSLPLCFLAFILVAFFGSRILYSNSLFQNWVQSQIASDTKGKFKFQTIRGGAVSAKLENLSLDLHGTAFNVQKVEAPEMRASFEWIPLLQNRLVIRSLTMEGGHLDIKLAGGSPAQTALPVSKSFGLRQGTVTVANFSGWTLEMTECDLRATQSSSGADQIISGTVSAAHATIGGLNIENVESRFRLEGGRFHVEKLEALLPGKSKLECKGSYALDGKPELELEMTVDSSDIRSLLQAVDFSNRFAGRANVIVKTKGLFTPSIHSLSGDGSATVSNIDPDVALPRLPAFNNAPIFKHVRAIDDLEGKVGFQLNGNKILVQQIDIKNKEIHVTGTAQIGYDRSLSSNMIFNGDKTVAAEIPAIARNIFTYDQEGQVIIPFQLKPNTRDPQVDAGDIVNRVISDQVKGLNPLNLFK